MYFLLLQAKMILKRMKNTNSRERFNQIMLMKALLFLNQIVLTNANNHFVYFLLNVFFSVSYFYSLSKCCGYREFRKDNE